MLRPGTASLSPESPRRSVRKSPRRCEARQLRQSYPRNRERKTEPEKAPAETPVQEHTTGSARQTECTRQQRHAASYTPCDCQLEKFRAAVQDILYIELRDDGI